MDRSISVKQETNSEGGPHPAYSAGKSWDAASGPTGCDKKFCHADTKMQAVMEFFTCEEGVIPGLKIAGVFTATIASEETLGCIDLSCQTSDRSSHEDRNCN